MNIQIVGSFSDCKFASEQFCNLRDNSKVVYVRAGEIRAVRDSKESHYEVNVSMVCNE